jgi:hypothetical protein
MTFAQLRTLASTWLDDINNTYFTAAQVNVYLNQAQREAQKMLLNSSQDYYSKCSTTPTVIGQARYAFPSDFLKVQRLSYITQGSGDTATYQKITAITRNEQDVVLYQPSGAPLAYYVNKDTFAIVPTPDQVYTVHLDYSYRVADMSADGDVPDVPEDYHELIAILAARDGFLRDGRDLSPIEVKMNVYKDLMKQNAQQRTQDAPRSVVTTQGGFGGF